MDQAGMLTPMSLLAPLHKIDQAGTHTNDSAQDNDSPSHPKRIKLVNLLGDILDSPTAQTKIKWKKIITEAEI